MIQHFIIGLIMTFVGLLPPGMMNMTVVRHAISTGTLPARLFAAGAATVVGIQSLIALTFADWLLSNPNVVVLLRKLAILVFVLLAIYFYRLSRKAINIRERDGGQNYFWAGMFMSSLNMLAIPFFLGYSTVMNMNGWLKFEYPFILFFTIGAIVGSFGLFMTYARFARYISEKVGFIARNVNLILSILFVILAFISAWSVLHTGN